MRRRQTRLLDRSSDDGEHGGLGASHAEEHEATVEGHDQLENRVGERFLDDDLGRLLERLDLPSLQSQCHRVALCASTHCFAGFEQHGVDQKADDESGGWPAAEEKGNKVDWVCGGACAGRGGCQKEHGRYVTSVRERAGFAFAGAHVGSTHTEPSPRT